MRPVDDGPHPEGKWGRRVEIGALRNVLGPSELDNPRPTCVTCSRIWHGKTGLPARCIVERALIMRVERGYIAIVHCHGASAILELGETTTELAIASRYVF